MHPISGVTVVCDFLRPDGRGRPGGVDRSASWLHSAVKRQVALASGLTLDLLTPSTSPELAAWVAAQRDPADADAFWAGCFEKLSSVPNWGHAIERHIVVPLRNRFCIGYELPPYFVELLDRQAIPYVDVRLHPIRFLDDLLFAVRGSHEATQIMLSDTAVPESAVAITAGLREAMCRYISDARIPANTLLVVGQKRYDSSQIEGGRFFDAADWRETIAAIGARHDAVILKPHPEDREHSLLLVAAGVCRNVLGTTNDNIYRLLALPEVTSVLTVSSSVAYEAPHFGKSVATLAKPRVRLGWRGDAAEVDLHLALDDVLLSVDFWRAVLAPHAATTASDGVRLPPKANRLRLALDSFWSFNEIDTDRIPPRTA